MATTITANGTGALPASPLQDTLALIGRLVLAWFFVPAGWGKVAGFAGTPVKLA